MTWTRMTDGSYYAVKTIFGERTGYSVRKCPDGWRLDVDGEPVAFFRTCREAKDEATRRHCRKASDALANKALA